MKFKHLFQHLFNYLLLSLGLFATSQHLNGQTSGVNLKPRFYLQGALHGLLPAATLMRDDLRAQGLLPIVEPYTALGYAFWNISINNGGGESIANPAVFQKTGSSAIVDWVLVELRSTTALDSVIWSRAALVQRDGDVVDVDGVSPVNFPNASPGPYYVAVRHRNHLGVMTGESMDLSENAVSVDFTDPDFPNNCGQLGMATIGNKRVLWGGDLNHNGRVVYQGPGNDILKLFTNVLYDANNVSLSASFIAKGYLQGDANMDGKAIYQGIGNDRSIVFQYVMQMYNGIWSGDFVILECIP